MNLTRSWMSENGSLWPHTCLTVWVWNLCKITFIRWFLAFSVTDKRLILVTRIWVFIGKLLLSPHRKLLRFFLYVLQVWNFKLFLSSCWAFEQKSQVSLRLRIFFSVISLLISFLQLCFLLLELKLVGHYIFWLSPLCL